MKRRSRKGKRNRLLPGWMGLSGLAVFMMLVALTGCSNIFNWQGGDFRQAGAIAEAGQEAAIVDGYVSDIEQSQAAHAELPGEPEPPHTVTLPAEESTTSADLPDQPTAQQSASSPGQPVPSFSERSEPPQSGAEEGSMEEAAAGEGQTRDAAADAEKADVDVDELADWIALTFDDGPDLKYTPQVLDILKEYDVKATFFLVGTQVEKYPEIARRIVDEGHAVGNHSWSHKDLTKLNKKALDGQVKRTQEVIREATGVEPALVRAPYGALSNGLIEYFHDLKLLHVYWTVDPRDWAGTSVAVMRSNIAEHAKPGGIILLHSFGGRKNALDHTLELLPLVIEDLQHAGYAFATVEQMIETKAVIASAIK